MARPVEPMQPSRRPARDAADTDDPRRELDLAQKRIAELESELARQGRVRTELVHLVAHELRTPITVMTGFGRLLRQSDESGRFSEQQRHFIDETLKACRRLDRFVDDLLAAGAQSGTPLSVEIVESDLHETIRGQLAALAPLLDERRIRLDLALASDLDRFAFDPRRVEQVITNLMTNAIRYGRSRGRIRIATSLQRDDSGKEVVAICVEDDGPGIPEQDRERLFAPYVRGEACAGPEGLGIGLAICRRIALAHGGAISVDRGALGGARFVFSLPRRREVVGEG